MITDAMVEAAWVAIPGYAGKYLVSASGRIIFARSRKDVRFWVNGKGYARVRLTNEEGRKDYPVHRIVASAFLPIAHTTETVNHKNGVKLDNRAENLEWATREENTRHAIECGLGDYRPPRMTGIKHGQAKLTDDIVLLARAERRDTGISFQKLADKVGVSKKTLMEAVNGKTWKHIPTPPEAT